MAGLDDVWAVWSPGGGQRRFGVPLSGEVLDAAVAGVGPAGAPPPVEVAQWLTAADWAESRRVFREHSGFLVGDGVVRQWLRDIDARAGADHETSVHAVILDLAQREKTGVAFDYLEASGPARADVAFRAALGGDWDLLSTVVRLVEGARRDAQDDANAAVLRTLHSIRKDLTATMTESDRRRIMQLPMQERSGLLARLEELRRAAEVERDGIRQALIEEIQETVLSC